MNHRKILGLSILFLLNACAGQKTPEAIVLNEQDGSRIIGGTEVKPDDPIAATIVGLYDTVREAVCTGSLVSRNLVITAAHCIAGAPTDVVVVFGLDFETENIVVRPVVDAEFAPILAKRSEDSVDMGDIALVKFSGAVPRGYKPAKLLGRLDGISDGRTVTLAGYGMSNSAKKSGTGRLRKADAQIKKLRYTKTEFLVDQTHGRGACHGDSGGAAYVTVNGEAFVMGVTSRTVNDPKDTCGMFTAYTNVPVYLKWLNAAAKNLNSRRSVEPSRRPTRNPVRTRDAKPLAGA